MSTVEQEFVTDPNLIQEALGKWPGFLDEKLVKNIAVFAKKGQLAVNVSNFQEEDSWDGSLMIKLTGIGTEDLINYVIGWAMPDELSCEDGVVRLWWD